MFIIYQITNKTNGKRYIGKTVWPINRRLKKHFQMANAGAKTYLHRAIRKYGKENFSIEVLEEGWCPKIGVVIREPYWISVLTPEYNMTVGGEGVVGYTWSEEHRINTSAAQTGLKKGPYPETHGANISKALKGRKLSLEHRLAMTGPRKPYGKRIKQQTLLNRVECA